MANSVALASEPAPVALVATDVPAMDKTKAALDVYVKAYHAVGWMIPDLQRAHAEAQRILKG